MEWFSFPLPAWWLWVVSIIGIMAFVMAVKPFVQAIWGKPKIEVDFGVKDLEGGRVLQCEICNPPIRHKILRLLGVTRVIAEDITASFSIEEYGSGRVIFSGAVPSIITYSGTTGAQRISLPPSVFPANFAIVIVVDTEKKVRVFEENIILLSGKYCANVEVRMVDKTIKVKKRFVVSQTHPFAYWEA